MVLMFICHVAVFALGGISHHQPLHDLKREETIELITAGCILSNELEVIICHAPVESFSGVVSFYALHKMTQANGKKHDKYAFTAAHRTLPMGTRLLVYSVITDRYVIVVVTDRGPYPKDRVLDLSLAAMNSLGIKDLGVSRCLIIPLTPPKPPATTVS